MRIIVTEPDEDDIANDYLDAPIIENLDVKNFELRTLEDMVLLGLAFKEVAGLLFLDLVQELKLIQDQPVMFAVDNYNVWEVPSAFSFDEKTIYGHSLLVPHALHFLSLKKADTEKWPVTNGLCLAAVSSYYPEGRNITYQDISRSVPFALKVPTYNQVEYLSAVLSYMRLHRIQDSLENHELLAFRVYAASNPKNVRRDAMEYLFPINMSKEDFDFMASYYREGDSFSDKRNIAYDKMGPKGIPWEELGMGPEPMGRAKVSATTSAADENKSDKNDKNDKNKKRVVKGRAVRIALKKSRGRK